MSYKGMMDGWHGDEPEIEAKERRIRDERYDNAFDDANDDSILGLANAIKTLSDKIKNGAK